MKLLWCLAFLAVSVSAKAIDNDTNDNDDTNDNNDINDINDNNNGNKTGHKKDRIVGGRSADIETLPYQAQLLQNGHQICGASIISKRWLVTAAHCIAESSPKWTIITGSSHVSKGGQHHEIKEVIVHPDYDEDTTDNDIALIELKRPLVFNERQRAIPLATTVPKVGDKMTVSGFGKLGEEKGYAKVLQVVDVPIVDHEKCKKQYTLDPITDNMFCAGEGSTDSCQGDSGGPGVLNGELVGVVSSGELCASKTHPGLYTTVYNYLDWIKKTTKINNSRTGKMFKIPIISDVIDIMLHRQP